MEHQRKFGIVESQSREVLKMYGGYSKGGTIHHLKSTAQEIAKQARSVGMGARIVKVAKGWRVDKKY